MAKNLSSGSNTDQRIIEFNSRVKAIADSLKLRTNIIKGNGGQRTYVLGSQEPLFVSDVNVLTNPTLRLKTLNDLFNRVAGAKVNRQLIDYRSTLEHEIHTRSFKPSDVVPLSQTVAAISDVLSTEPTATEDDITPKPSTDQAAEVDPALNSNAASATGASETDAGSTGELATAETGTAEIVIVEPSVEASSVDLNVALQNQLGLRDPADIWSASDVPEVDHVIAEDGNAEGGSAEANVGELPEEAVTETRSVEQGDITDASVASDLIAEEDGVAAQEEATHAEETVDDVTSLNVIANGPNMAEPMHSLSDAVHKRLNDISMTPEVFIEYARGIIGVEGKEIIDTLTKNPVKVISGESYATPGADIIVSIYNDYSKKEAFPPLTVYEFFGISRLSQHNKLLSPLKEKFWTNVLRAIQSSGYKAKDFDDLPVSTGNLSVYLGVRFINLYIGQGQPSKPLSDMAKAFKCEPEDLLSLADWHKANGRKAPKSKVDVADSSDEAGQTQPALPTTILVGEPDPVQPVVDAQVPAVIVVSPEPPPSEAIAPPAEDVFQASASSLTTEGAPTMGLSIRQTVGPALSIVPGASSNPVTEMPLDRPLTITVDFRQAALEVLKTFIELEAEGAAFAYLQRADLERPDLPAEEALADLRRAYGHDKLKAVKLLEKARDRLLDAANAEVTLSSVVDAVREFRAHDNVELSRRLLQEPASELLAAEFGLTAKQAEAAHQRLINHVAHVMHLGPTPE